LTGTGRLEMQRPVTDRPGLQKHGLVDALIGRLEMQRPVPDRPGLQKHGLVDALINN